MKATFENSVNVLVKAYFDGYLNAMQCSCCAVGNLVAASCGYTFDRFGNWNETNIGPQWKNAISFRQIITERYRGETKREIDSTGYTPSELNLIEAAFMDNAATEMHPERDNFDGLMAVVDVLAEIHNIDLKTKSEAKAMFVKAETL